jgi:predicted RNase H-like nuclease (RuvC/YqgF family)
MSIRMVAVELYRVMKKTEELEKELESLEAGSQQRVEIERDIRAARFQRDRLKKMIEGAKGD